MNVEFDRFAILSFARKLDFALPVVIDSMAVFMARILLANAKHFAGV